ncbi:hypothetical protein DH2020_009423 [Rehmannia glutinosa]|uniref:Glycosyltransferase n=1 Tax=Rehmannia glutinosa TaxID=99300 RepID=A0ABR0X9H7_REHGL
MAPLSSSSSKPHIVIFPFMSKGHTIPLLHLARHLLLRPGVAITIFTTPANHPFNSQFLAGANNISIIDLSFPNNIPGIPNGIESTDKLPSMSLFLPFVNGVKLMQPSFEKSLEQIHKHVTCIISDGFLHWTLQSASKFNIPRLSFYGMSYYAMAVSREASVNGLLPLHESDDEQFTVTGFPWIKLCRNDFDDPFDKRDPRGPHLDFIIECRTATASSYGIVMNTPTKINPDKPKWIQWLDQKSTEGFPVLYVAFGSQANISLKQLREIAVGLENSETRFLWVVRTNKAGLISDDFEERVKERGIIVNEWVDQRAILEHEIVKGFLSHCGWNSVLEGICAEVPILAWPLMAEQFLNAKFVSEEIKIGLRVETVDGKTKGFVTGESLKCSVVELMEGEKGKKLRENVKDVGEMARKSMADGGASWEDLNRLIEETCRLKEINGSNVNQIKMI